MSSALRVLLSNSKIALLSDLGRGGQLPRPALRAIPNYPGDPSRNIREAPSTLELSRSDVPHDHPLAAVFPVLADDDLQSLADDIKTNGLQQPIVIDEAGVSIDGRNRLAAGAMAGIEPYSLTIRSADKRPKARLRRSGQGRPKTGQH